MSSAAFKAAVRLLELVKIYGLCKAITVKAAPFWKVALAQGSQ